MDLIEAKAMLRRVIGREVITRDTYIFIDRKSAHNQFEAAELLIEAGYFMPGQLKEFRTAHGEDDQYAQLRFYLTEKAVSEFGK